MPTGRTHPMEFIPSATDRPAGDELVRLYDIAYLQDVLVDPAWHRRGLGRRLVDAVFAPFDRVRQHVLLTDDEPAQRALYESLGFRETRDLGEGRLRAFVRFNAGT